MEFFELEYFVVIASTENLQTAAKRLGVTPAALSKTVKRLEDELRVSLFERRGRNIHLSSQGELLAKKAEMLLKGRDSLKLELSDHQAVEKVVMSGLDTHLSHLTVPLMKAIVAMQPKACFHSVALSNEATIKWLDEDRAHFGLVSEKPPIRLPSKIIQQSRFQVYAATDHVLLKSKKGSKLRFQDVMTHGFVTLDSPLLGKLSERGSNDGWSEKEWPRQKSQVTTSLGLLLQLVRAGLALAYLPEYVGNDPGIRPLTIADMPFETRQTIYLAGNRHLPPWLQRILS